MDNPKISTLCFFLIILINLQAQNPDPSKSGKIVTGTPHLSVFTTGDIVSNDQFWDEILASNKGKVLYIDIWATWCVPCRAEMPESAKLQERYQGKPVVFIYFCGGNSDESTWRKVIGQCQVTGNHYLLNEELSTFIFNKFSVMGVPRHILIAQNGNVADPNAPGPGSAKIITEIDKLLENK